MAGWYYCFVPNFSTIAEPLNALERNGAQFILTPACQAAFEKLKEHLITPPVLGHPNFNVPFVVYTNASMIGLGAVLVQKSDPGTEEVLAFASRSLNSAGRNCAATELAECQAVYQKIVEKDKVIINSNTYIDIMEDLIYRVVTLPYKTLYQLYIPASLKNETSGVLLPRSPFWSSWKAQNLLEIAK